MAVVYKRPEALTDMNFKYCGGCGHGLVNKILAEILDERGLAGKTIMVWPIGCSVFADQYFKTDSVCALHGRAPALATGLKRARPDNLVIVYQGDGDMVSEGMSEIIHAAIRGEKLSVIFVNNAIYGMTGGQMAPTTLIGQKTTTSPFGRSVEAAGYPVNMAELIANIRGCIYSERVTVNTPARLAATKKAIAKAIDLQLSGRGLSFVEVLSPCPTGWGMKALDALDFIDSDMLPIYPLGVIKEAEHE
ncbi:2-oxoglutarate oxidoreductase subunit KorB [bioreactor metagenome]|uniref:2-oxoglutarate oxidoreductase subunit KorB n=1 Tax=bioreactor metagenome TaxID=1076179 RepID=A0A644XRY7_9ZZZZ